MKPSAALKGQARFRRNREGLDADDVEVAAVRVAWEALAAGRAALPEYGSCFSRCDHTQAQLFAFLMLWQFLRTDYWGVVAVVSQFELSSASKSGIGRGAAGRNGSNKDH